MKLTKKDVKVGAGFCAGLLVTAIIITAPVAIAAYLNTKKYFSDVDLEL